MNKNVLTFHIPAGNSRFDIFECSNGDFFVVVYKSDKCIEPGLHDRKEMFDDQQIEPVYAIRFDTIDQLHAYVDAFVYMYKCALKKTKKDDDV